MSLRGCRLVPILVPLAIGSLGAQTLSRLDAGGGAGGSVFGWQPRVNLNGETQPLSLGPLRAGFHASLGRVAAPVSPQFEFLGGATLVSAPAPTGWWLGAEAVERTGFKDVIEQPRIETGGWHRIGNVLVTISAARRSAAVSGMSHFSRTVTSYNSYLDTTTGHWDSTEVTRTITDSTRRAETQRWAETQAALSWEGRYASVGLALGGRLASRGVPRGAWASADIAVRLASQLALVVGAGNATNARFALDGEHRYVTLGFRVSPHLTSSVAAAPPVPAAAVVSAFAVESVGEGNYRLTLSAPHAHRIEISGDFTGWKAVPLERGHDGRWSLTTSLTAGTHRVNTRIDGGSWIAPPGLTTMSDDFAGEVGVLVIERSQKVEGPTK